MGKPPTCGGSPRSIGLTLISNDRFRIRAQRFFLTYSQIPQNFDQSGLQNFLKEKCPNATCICAALEEHPTTGGHHIHVYLDTDETFIVNDPRFFDFSDVHPNIKGIRVTPHKAYEYTRKQGNIIWEEGIAPEAPAAKKTHDEKWHIIMEAGNKEEFLKAAERLAPRDTVLHFHSLQSYADWKYRDNPDEYVSPKTDFNPQKWNTLADWVQQELHGELNDRRKSLIIWGPSRLGKTLWARSLGKHAYFPGLFMLEGFNASEAEYAIFDDMLDGLNSIPNWKFWMGSQREFVIGDKYMRKQRIAWGKPSIYIANTDPRENRSSEDIAWLEANCTFVKIDSHLAAPIEKEDAEENANEENMFLLDS